MLRAALALLLVAAYPIAAAAQNDELDRIPSLPDAAPPSAGEATTPRTSASGRFYLENAATASSLRAGLVVPLPPPRPADWQNRTSFDATQQWILGSRLTANLSNRFNATEASSLPFPTHRNLRNDFREGYVSWEPLAQSYLEAGRVNVRNGIALGFNPTDFFKTRSLVDQVSLDPSIVRQDRLGAFMTRAQYLWGGGSASLAFAPKLYEPTPIETGIASGFGPRFDRTNSFDRILLTLNYDVGDFAPQALLYREGATTRYGLNLSHGLGQSVIAYAEWAGGRQADLIDRAIAYGKRTGSIPAVAPSPLPSDTAKDFRSDLALGASWTSSAKLTLNLEYHYHQAGFSAADWRRWFAAGGTSQTAGQLWYIRGFANDQQEPVSRQQAFLRLDWTDAFVRDLELTAFAFIDLYDGSSLAQASASYYLSDNWTIGAYLSANLGGKRSERGSAPQEGSAILQLVRYF